MAPEGLADFAGWWRLTRRIDDRLTGVAGRLAGTAEFRAEGIGLLCEERGLLRYGDAPPLEAVRRYFWRAAPAGRIAVAFEDGRPFHSFPLAPAASAQHDCAPDVYLVAYDFSAWPNWRAEWTATGPRKNYVSVSDYAPLPA